jgi:hypothetical protein
MASGTDDAALLMKSAAACNDSGPNWRPKAAGFAAAAARRTRPNDVPGLRVNHSLKKTHYSTRRGRAPRLYLHGRRSYPGRKQIDVNLVQDFISAGLKISKGPSIFGCLPRASHFDLEPARHTQSMIAHAPNWKT